MQETGLFFRIPARYAPKFGEFLYYELRYIWPFPAVLPRERPPEAHLTSPIAQDGVEREFSQFCVLGVARFH